MFEELEELYKSLMSNDMKPEDITAYEPLSTLHNNIRKLKEEQELGSCGLMLINFVAIVGIFIRAERTGNWMLHLKATQEMLPFFLQGTTITANVVEFIYKTVKTPVHVCRNP